MANTPLIKILADGKLHSGEDLARALGVSRTAVWKQLSQLQEQGLQINRMRGQGYCLPQPLDLLDVETLCEQLSPSMQSEVDLNLFASLPSTNDYLSTQPAPSAPFAVCLAEQQSAGKGRRGRIWQSPFARNLYLSLAFDSARGVSGLDGLSLVIGLAVLKSLEALGVGGLKIKWPNDLWLHGRKLAGILVELSGELQTRCRVVVGLGLNVYMEVEDGVSIDQPWTSLAQAGAVPEGGRNRLAGQLLSDLLLTLKIFEERGFAAFRDQWNAYDALKGRQLYVVGSETTGIGAGIDERGAYCLQTDGEVVYLNAGEVSIRANEA
jgi:BirA family biotin operon repressor/biotin-[acetyl-CoA-carboxylase] ligase